MDTVMDKSDIVDLLNDLIEVSKDGEYGFRETAEHAKSPNIRSTLSARSADCAAGAAELQRLVTTYGGKPETSGSTGGALHRGWVSVRSALTSKDDLAVLEEAERGEDSALKKYREAASKALPADVQAVVQKQLQGAQRNHDQIKTLRDSVKAAAA
ncbi:MAG: PA2169 family four-helix-bundle protein [Burkholderiaceae bacterium]